MSSQIHINTWVHSFLHIATTMSPARQQYGGAPKVCVARCKIQRVLLLLISKIDTWRNCLNLNFKLPSEFFPHDRNQQKFNQTSLSNNKFPNLHIFSCFSWTEGMVKQECIPVGCVPSTSVVIRGEEICPGAVYQDTPRPTGRNPPVEQNSWHTLVKTLPSRYYCCRW